MKVAENFGGYFFTFQDNQECKFGDFFTFQDNRDVKIPRLYLIRLLLGGIRLMVIAIQATNIQLKINNNENTTIFLKYLHYKLFIVA